VRRVFELTLMGAGEHRIACSLNEEGVPVLGRGMLWHRSTVAKMVRNPAVIGTLIPGHMRYSNGHRVRVHEDPIPGAFPPIIKENDWLAVRTLKDGQVHAPRGRNAGREVTNIFAGLARCPLCGSAMARINKGAPEKGGRPKFVCRAAKAKAGCRYVSVPVEDAETAFLHSWAHLWDTVPTPNGGEDLDALRRNLEAAIWGTEDHLENLAAALKQQPLQATLREMARVEAELRSMRVELDEVDHRRSTADRGLIECRLAHLQGLIEQEGGPDRAAINITLKLLLTGVVVDFRTGHLRFQWRQGGESELMYTWID
jgi:hypothetical protein